MQTSQPCTTLFSENMLYCQSVNVKCATCAQFPRSQHPQYNQWWQLHHCQSYIQVTSLNGDTVASLSLIALQTASTLHYISPTELNSQASSNIAPPTWCLNDGLPADCCITLTFVPSSVQGFVRSHGRLERIHLQINTTLTWQIELHKITSSSHKRRVDLHAPDPPRTTSLISSVTHALTPPPPKYPALSKA